MLFTLSSTLTCKFFNLRVYSEGKHRITQKSLFIAYFSRTLATSLP